MLEDRADELGKIDPETGVGRGLCHDRKHDEPRHDEGPVADPLDLVDAAADRRAENHEIERGRDHGRYDRLPKRAEEPAHLENVNGLDGVQVHASSFTRLTKISSSELCRV